MPPTFDDEVTYISGLNADGTLALNSAASWNGDKPATYTGGYTQAFKWYGTAGANTAGTTGGTVTYAFNPASSWTTAEKNEFIAGLSLWAAVANISFTLTTDYTNAGIKFTRGSDGAAHTTPSGNVPTGAGVTGGTKLLQLTNATISIDTSAAGFGPLDGTYTTYGGYPWQTLLHEEGHALGLDHGGPYPLSDSTPSDTLQYSPYDTRLYTVMSYVSPTDTAATYYNQQPVTGTNWGTTQIDATHFTNNVSTTWMPADILAIQRIYGVATNTPLSGGQVFGFNTNITGAIAGFFDFNRNTKPVVTLWDAGTNNTLDLSGFFQGATVNLNAGTYSSAAGLTNNIAIAYNTWIDKFVGGIGDDTVTGNAHGNTIKGGLGNDAINGGSDIDTAVFNGAKLTYTITQPSTGVFTIKGPDGTDTLTNVEYAKFDDQTYRLLPGSGTVVDFGSQPAVYMGAIRDFDGNNLTGQGTQVINPNTGSLVAGSAWDGTSGWTLAGTADVSGSGTQARILFNNLIGRWAEVTPQSSDNGKVYFNNYGWAGDTRIVGIYTDPEVALGHAVQGGPNDSQRRFQNDLFIGNIKSVLSAGDYNHDGFQEVYFSLTDGTAYLHALMWNDGNIQYANYQSAQQVQDYFTANNVSSSVWSSWLHEEPMQVFATAGAMAPPLLGQTGNTLAGVAV
jgi:hypothetical protein